MTWRFDPKDFHIRSAYRAFEHHGVPVVVRGVGSYAEASDGVRSTRDVAHVLVSIWGGFAGGRQFHNNVTVEVRDAQRRTLRVYEGKHAERALEALIEEGLAQLDAAVSRLRGLDAEYAAAARRANPALSERGPLDRAGYEAACALHRAQETLSDAECLSYGVRYGQFSYPEYDAETIVSMHLARRRLMGIEQAMKAARPTAETLPASHAFPKMEGQLWEDCERCGRQPVYMPLHRCKACWPNDVAHVV